MAQRVPQQVGNGLGNALAVAHACGVSGRLDVNGASWVVRPQFARPSDADLAHVDGGRGDPHAFAQAAANESRRSSSRLWMRRLPRRIRLPRFGA